MDLGYWSATFGVAKYTILEPFWFSARQIPDRLSDWVVDIDQNKAKQSKLSQKGGNRCNEYYCNINSRICVWKCKYLLSSRLKKDCLDNFFDHVDYIYNCLH